MNPVAGPRPAATVALVRDGVDGVEAYLQRRPRTMGFAGGLWVFPGGRIDAADADPAVDAIWGGPPPAAWAERMGVTAEQARGFVVAACRETFEEAGVLLVDRPPDPLPLQAGRGALLAGERGLAAMLPPTRFTLRDLAGFRTVEELLEAGHHRPVEQVLPRLEGRVLIMPWNERYPVPVPPDREASP